jgi:hypothetical protein
MVTTPGDVAHVDFGYVGRLYDPPQRTQRKAWCFVMVLAPSGRMVVQVVFDQRAETWLKLHVEAFEELGVVPRTVVSASRGEVHVAIWLLSVLLRWRPMRDFAVRRLAEVRAPVPRPGRTASWTRVRAEWSDGTTREGWLRTGDGMDFTVAVLSEVAARLSSGAARPGAYTPSVLFGPELAEAARAEISVRVEEPRLGARCGPEEVEATDCDRSISTASE